MSNILQTATEATLQFPGNKTSVTVVFSSAGTVDSRYVVVVQSENETATIGVSDNRNSAYTQDVIFTNTGSNINGRGRIAIYSVENASALTATVTVTFSAGSYGQVVIYEVTGIATGSAVDSTGTAGADAANFTCSLTTTVAGCTIFVGSTVYVDAIAGADSGYVSSYGAVAANNGYAWSERNTDAGAAGTKTVTGGYTSNPTTNCSIAMVAYRPAVVLASVPTYANTPRADELIALGSVVGPYSWIKPRSWF